MSSSAVEDITAGAARSNSMGGMTNETITLVKDEVINASDVVKKVGR